MDLISIYKEKLGENLMNDDILTNFNMMKGLVVVDFGQSKRVAKIIHFVRTSFETFQSRCYSDLLYWNNKWFSLSQKRKKRFFKI